MARPTRSSRSPFSFQSLAIFGLLSGVAVLLAAATELLIMPALLQVIVARREGAMMMVHAENYDVIRWLIDKLVAKGHTDPKYHAIS